MAKKWFAMALKFLVSGILIWLLLSKIDIGDAMGKLVDVEVKMLAMAMLVILVQSVICGLRWTAVLLAVGQPLGFLKAVQFSLIGSFFNQALPSAVGGDAVRMYKAFQYGLGLRCAINGVVLERAITVVALILLVNALLPWFAPRVDDLMMKMIFNGLFIITLGAVLGLFLLMLLDQIPKPLQHWRLMRGLGNLGSDARKLFLSWYLPRAMIWGFATHINLSFSVFLLAFGLSVDVSWFDCLVLMPPVILVMTLPISIAGWGVRETVMVVLFGLIDVPAEEVVVLSILFGLTCVAMALPGGVIWLLTRDKGESMNYQTPNEKNSGLDLAKETVQYSGSKTPRGSFNDKL